MTRLAAYVQVDYREFTSVKCIFNLVLNYFNKSRAGQIEGPYLATDLVWEFGEEFECIGMEIEELSFLALSSIGRRRCYVRSRCIDICSGSVRGDDDIFAQYDIYR